MKIEKRIMDILLNNAKPLTKDEWVKFGDWLDGGGNLLDSVNKYLAKIAPEVFSESTTDEKDYPTYQTHDPKGWCGDPTRGAALGRHAFLGNPKFDGKLLLREVRLNQGGYDCNGTYFGCGQPLFWFASPHEDGIDDVLRATNREDAKQQILKRYPKTKFFR